MGRPIQFGIYRPGKLPQYMYIPVYTHPPPPPDNHIHYSVPPLITYIYIYMYMYIIIPTLAYVLCIYIYLFPCWRGVGAVCVGETGRLAGSTQALITCLLSLLLLRALRYGEIESLRLLNGRHCAFVNYANASAAAKALKALQVCAVSASLV